MTLDAKTKKHIDSMTYESMLRRWRFAPIGDTMFQGEAGEYFGMVMRQKRDSLLDGEHVAASKRIGW